MSTLSNGARQWYPNLKGIANPKSPFEVQTADAVHQAMSYLYDINDRVNALAKPPAAGPAQASSENWWESPYAVDGFSGNATSSAITLNWTRYHLAPVVFENRKTQYVNVPPGSITASGLSANTWYYFFPAWDLHSKQVVWAVDPATVVAGTYAHTQSTPVALVRSSIGPRVPLSTGGISVKTNEGSFTGRGGGLIVTSLKKAGGS